MTRFEKLCRVFNESGPPLQNVIDPGVRLPQWTLRDLDSVLKEIVDPANIPPEFPPRYRTGYVARLRKNRSSVIAGLRRKQTEFLLQQEGVEYSAEKAQQWADLLAEAIVGWGNEENIEILRRFAAVVSDIYYGFFLEARRANPDLKPGTYYPPMIALMEDRKRWGPHALNGREMFELSRSAIGVVALPRNFSDHPLFWTLLAHEVGGHSATNGISAGLGHPWHLLDIPGQIVDSVTDKVIHEKEWLPVWKHWAVEMAADVYGLLFMGPYFVVSLAAFLSWAKARDPFGPQTPLGCLENVIYLRNGVLADDHPPDILRLWLAMGVADAMIEKGESHAKAWITLFEEILESAKGTTNTLDVHDVTVGGISLRIESQPLFEDARRMGRHIALTCLSVPSSSAGTRGIIDLVKWTEADERLAMTVRKLVEETPDDTGDHGRNFTSAHLLAGATMAIFDGKADYTRTTGFLNSALSARFGLTPFTSRSTRTARTVETSD